MEWKHIYNRTTNNIKNNIKTKTFRIKNIRLKYIGSGILYYSYKKNNSIKTGSFVIKKLMPVKYAGLTIGCMVLLYLPTVFLNSNKNNNNTFESNTMGIGGVGEINIQKEDLTNINSLTSEQIEASEKMKDELLADSETEEVNTETDGTPQKISYKVKDGDTLSHISQKFNISIEAIAGSSGIRHPDDLRVGQVLQIPSKEGFFYTVQKKERLADIIISYDVEPEKFLNENPFINPDLLEEGDEIFLPDAKPKNLIHAWLIPTPSRFITSGYGWRTYPRRAFHKGIDLKAAFTSIRSAKHGTIKFAGWLGGYGKAVIISHPGGYRTLYAHLSKIYVKAGASVSRGHIIGISGNTGYSFGPHLHFEVTRRGKHINPGDILKGLRGKRRRR